MASTSSKCNGAPDKKKQRTLDNMLVTLKSQSMNNKATASTSSSSATTNTDTDNDVDMVTLHHVKLQQATTETDAYVFDIGELDFRNQLSDTQQFNILNNIFVPDKTWKGPLRQVGKTKRRVPNSVFDQSRLE